MGNFSNKTAIKKLRKAKLPILEEIIYDVIDLYSPIKEKYKENPIKLIPITPKRIKDEYNDVKFYVDELLNSFNIYPPEVKKSKFKDAGFLIDYYEPGEEIIYLKPDIREELILAYAHEYTHHVQENKGLELFERNTIITEGFARGIEKIICHLYAETEKNDLFIQDTYSLISNEILYGYAWLSYTNGAKRDEKLMRKLFKLNGYKKNKKTKIHKLTQDICQYDYGTILMLMLEKKYGVDIYKEILESKKIPDL